jgi:exopolysaccharide biosynthesis protein
MRRAFGGAVFALGMVATVATVATLATVPPAPVAQAFELGPARTIVPGVTLYHVTDQDHLNPPAPVSAWLLRLDLATVDLRAALANDEIVDTETVADTASRHHAVAAVNAGFFLLPTGDPNGIYKIDGRLVSDTRRARGAVGLVRDGTVPRLVFDRVTATVSLRLRRSRWPDPRMDIHGVDTARQLAQLMLFTPAWHADTGTAPGGLEWVLQGQPLRITGEPLSTGKTPIPKDGFVLSYGGPRAPALLTRLRPGTEVALDTHYTAREGTPSDWRRADAIVGGAGLLIRDGRLIADWTMERLSAGFAETRHPRTLIGTHADGAVWLVTVDGRQPKLSAGMSLFELREFARRLGLTNALNLDGGGSTTMWADGRIVNSPSDAAGPRKVSDALLVIKR